MTAPDVAEAEPDDPELAALRRNLDLSPTERFDRVVQAARFVLAGREAWERSARRPEGPREMRGELGHDVAEGATDGSVLG